MDQLMQNFSGHPVIVIIALFIGVLIVYFLFKQLLKLALVFFLILLAIGGYYYLKDPQTMSRNMATTIEKAGKAVDRGKQVYEKGKAVVEEGKKLTRDMDNLAVGKNKITTHPDQKPEK